MPEGGERRAGGSRAVLYGVLFFASGAAGLVYQVVWMRSLGLLFGNTAEAAGATLTAFFLGLAAGGWAFARRATPLRRPLRTFAALELGVAVAALGVFAVLPLYEVLLPALYGAVGEMPRLFTLAKLGLALVCLVPAAFFMGGTFPALGEAFARDRQSVGRAAGLLYALNTLGAAGGALAATFWLPHVLGYRLTCVAAVGVSLGVAILALFAAGPERVAAQPGPARQQAPGRRGAALAFLSGFGALALEVLWTRQLAVHLQSSGYTFGLILVVVLLALGFGALLARSLMRRRRMRATLVGLLGCAAALVAWTPSWFDVVRGSTWLPSGTSGFGAYVGSVFVEALVVLGPAALAVGLVLPYWVHVVARTTARGQPAAAVLGRLIAWNTVGAIAGAFTAGFLLGPWTGPRVAAAAVGILYAIAAVVLARPRSQRAVAVSAALAAVVLVGVGLAVLQARAGLVPSRETLIAVYHGSAGTVTVSRRGSIRKLRLNRGYALGGTAEPRWEHLQAHIPLLIHPAPKDVFFIGLGTGITAGAAVEHPVDTITVAELVPEVVEAARDHFGDYVLTRGLFTDRRVTIRIEDARTILRGTSRRFDVIVGDLFLPWKRGVGAVFNEEQLEAGRRRLRPGGLYAQWLPLYQLSESEFLSIAHTFARVFPQVTVWRGDFFDDRPIVALVGHERETALDAAAFEARFMRAGERGWLGSEAGAASIGFHLYAGSLAGISEDERRAWPPVTTDDRPWIELEAPIHDRARRAKQERVYTGTALLGLYEGMHAGLPPADDPFLAEATRTQQRWVEAGRYLYAYAAHRGLGDAKARRDAWREWLLRVRSPVRPEVSDWVR